MAEDLASALAALDAAPPDELPVIIGLLAGAMAKAQQRLVAVPSPAPTSVDDGLLDVAEAAALLGRSESWMRKRGRTLPGFVQPTGQGGRVRWARAALRVWRDGLASHTPERL